MATKKQTTIERILAQLDDELRKENLQRVGIRFEGQNFVLPEGITIQDAIDRLSRMAKMEDEVVETIFRLPNGHIDDILYNFYVKMTEKFQALIPDTQESFFGTMPGTSVTVTIGLNKTTVVPVGDVAIPGLPIKFSISVRQDKNDPMNSSVNVTAQCKRRYDPIIKALEAEVQDYLRNHSIFQNQGITSKFRFVDFSGDVSKVVYSPHEAKVLNANLFNILEHADAVEKSIGTIKRTILLYGAYGSGKTFTGKIAAQVALKNGWTVMTVEPGDNFEQAFRFAMRYQPCLLQFEDVDSITGDRERDVDLNKILDVMDGVLTKDAKVITLFTTNHKDRINRAMRRTGRIDVMLELGKITRESIVPMVKAYCGDALDGELDQDALFAESSGFSPVYVAEAVRRAKLYAISDGRTIINGEDVLNGMLEVKPQLAWQNGVHETMENTTLDDRIASIVQKVNEGTYQPVRQEVEQE